MKKNKLWVTLAAAVLAAVTALSGCGAGNETDNGSEKNGSTDSAIVNEVENLDENAGGEATDASQDKISGDEVSGDETLGEINVIFPIKLTDALDREVVIESADRVATLLGSFADMWYLAGGEVIASVNDTWTNYDLGLDDSVVNLGSMLKPNLELLVAAEPDLVIASAGNSAQIELAEALESTGITVVYFEVSDFTDYKSMLGTLTDITGYKDYYQTYALDVEKEIANIKARVEEVTAADGFEAPTVLFIRAAAGSVKAKGSTGTVGGEILADLGTVNIADSDGAILEDLSLEAIVAADPDYIFVTTQGDDTDAALANVEELLTSNPAWSSLSAVTNGNYYEIDKALYNSKPNARWAEAYKILADILYPEE